MRMKELESKSGVPRTTIHYYLREGLLPPPRKTASNTGVYSQAHLERLQLIHRLRNDEAGPLPLYLIERILELIDQGVNPEVAISLEKAVIDGNYSAENAGPFTLGELADASGIPESELEEYLNYGLILPVPGKQPPQFDQLDLAMAQTYHEVLCAMGWAPADFGHISRKVREISDYEWELRNRTVGGMSAAEAVPLRARMQRFANFLHRYLFYRCRLINIHSELQGDSDRN